MTQGLRSQIVLHRLLPRSEFERKHSRSQAFEIRNRLVEAIFRNQRSLVNVALTAHVPFAEVTRRVASLLENACQHRRFGVEPIRDSSLRIVFPIVQVGGDPPTLGVLPCRNRDS